MRDDTTQTKADLSRPLVETIVHPVGYAILRALTERAASAKELAKALSQPRSTVGDQLRKLQAHGLIEAVGQEARRGTVERFYRLAPAARWLDDAETGRLGANEKERVVRRVVREAIADVSGALATDVLDRRDDWCVGSSRVAVDARGWEELAGIHQRAVEEVERVRMESAERLANGDGRPLRALSWVMLLELDDLG
jgi:DNA-binding transcriptional ArsR family regulator